MKNFALAAAALAIATGAALSQEAPLSAGPNAADRPTTWQAQPQQALDLRATAGITAREPALKNSTADTPVYNGLGAGTDNGQYISMPPIVYGK
ncbi:MAG TPA: hypothetical protein VIU14_08025 [Mesorhizobium sp.]